MIEQFSYHPEDLFQLFGMKTDWNIRSLPSFEAISTSSTECIPNTLFIPLKDKRDGHEFIQDAITKGASHFLYEPKNSFFLKLSPEEKKKGIPVKNTLLALGKIASWHREKFSPIVIGITGSSGKTTTKELFHAAFSFLSKSELVVTEKNYNNEIGVPFTLLKITSRTRVAIVEMGMNHLKEISRLTNLTKPNIALITNIGSAHIENLGSPKNIAKAKSEIIEGLTKNSKIRNSKTIYVPKDCAHYDVVSKKAKKYGANLVSWKLNSSKKIEIMERTKEGYKVKIQNLEYTFPIPGKRILSNLQGALSVLMDLNIPEAVFFKSLENFQNTEKRLETIQTEFQIINDCYNANPESMESSIELAKFLSEDKNCILVLGDIFELGKFSKFYHKKVGEFIKGLDIYSVLTIGNDSRFFQSEKVETERFRHFENSETGISHLVSHLKKIANKGDTILIKASRGMKLERITNLLVGQRND